MTDLFLLKKRADALTVFRPVFEDEVFSAFYAYLDDPTVKKYAEFVSKLYDKNGGNWSRYVKKLCFLSENAVVKTVSRGVIASACLFDAMDKDLVTLQRFSDLTAEEILPDGAEELVGKFVTEPTTLGKDYRERLVHIGKHGYGVYAEYGFFRIEGEKIVPVLTPDRVRLTDLVDYDREREQVIKNTRALIQNLPAANALLTGDAGTGKSSTVKAVANEFFAEGLRLVELKRDQLHLLPSVLEKIGTNPLKFILFIDDLSFRADDEDFNALKAVLEGSVSARTNNAVVYATSNRRHAVKERFSDREGDDVHRNDAMQELFSLSDRFGLHVSFFKPDKKTYLHIVKKLACDAKIDLSDEELFSRAERFALERGGRSARLARQFVDALRAEE